MSEITLYVRRTRDRARAGERTVKIVAGRRKPILTLCFANSRTRALYNLRKWNVGTSVCEFFVSAMVTFECASIYDYAPAHRPVNGPQGPRILRPLLCDVKCCGECDQRIHGGSAT